MSSNLSALLTSLSNLDAGGCPAPFIGESIHPYKGGFYGGRNCAQNPLDTTKNASRCCIPCPVYDWVYRDEFKRLTDGAAWVNMVGFILCGFLLLSTLVLPPEATRRAYLNIILLVAIMLLELGFMIPLGQQPRQCFDAVTPNGQSSSLTCAFSGALVTFGLLFFVCWILIRSLFMHLQICWNKTPGSREYIAANVAAFSVTIGLTAATLAHAGVSYRFGAYCHVNVGSLATYWGWLFAFGGAALIVQLATFAYCIKIYLSSAWWKRDEVNTFSSMGDSFAPSSRVQSARATARRVRQVLLIQWRSLTIVTLAIFTTAFVCVVFIVKDDRLTRHAFDHVDSLIPWILCLLSSAGDKNKCLNLTGPIILPEDLAIATLFILGFIGIEVFFLLWRWEIATAWYALLRQPWWKSSFWTSRRSSTADRGFFEENKV